MHQLKALFLIFDHQENIYYATQLCRHREGLVVQICRQLSLDCPQLQPLVLQLACERENASVSQTIGYQSPLGICKPPAILVLFLVKAAKCVLHP